MSLSRPGPLSVRRRGQKVRLRRAAAEIGSAAPVFRAQPEGPAHRKTSARLGLQDRKRTSSFSNIRGHEAVAGRRRGARCRQCVAARSAGRRKCSVAKVPIARRHLERWRRRKASGRSRVDEVSRKTLEHTCLARTDTKVAQLHLRLSPSESSCPLKGSCVAMLVDEVKERFAR